MHLAIRFGDLEAVQELEQHDADDVVQPPHFIETPVVPRSYLDLKAEEVLGGNNSGTAYRIFEPLAGRPGLNPPKGEAASWDGWAKLKSALRKYDSSGRLVPIDPNDPDDKDLLDTITWGNGPSADASKFNTNARAPSHDTILVPMPTFKEYEQIGYAYVGNPEDSFKEVLEKTVHRYDAGTWSYTVKKLPSQLILDSELLQYVEGPRKVYTATMAHARKTSNLGDDFGSQNNHILYGVKALCPYWYSLHYKTGPDKSMTKFRLLVAVPGRLQTRSHVHQYLKQVGAWQKDRRYLHHTEDKLPVFFTQAPLFLDNSEKVGSAAGWLEGWTEGDDGPPHQASYHYHNGEPPQEQDFASLVPGLQIRTPKYGRGAKFFNYGPTACMNTIVTRFDEYGRVQILAQVRPQNADGDRGEYQMSSGVIFIPPAGKDGQVTLNDEISEKLGLERGSIAGGGQPGALTSIPGNCNANGKLQNDALNRARFGVLSKIYFGHDWTPEAKCVIFDGETLTSAHADKNGTGRSGDGTEREECKAMREARLVEIAFHVKGWNFYKIRAGIVDDTSSTREAWVETAYVVHHIMGLEDEGLDLFRRASPPVNALNVGRAVWHSIDKRTASSSLPGYNSTSPYGYNEFTPLRGATNEADHFETGPYNTINLKIQEPYDELAEYEMWHGDHSIASSDIAEFVLTNFEFVGRATGGAGDSNWFGESRLKDGSDFVTMRAEYVKAAGAENCPLGLMVDTKKECEETAGAAVGHPFNKEIPPKKTERPAGCFWDQNGQSYFNPELKAKTNYGGAGAICRVSARIEELDEEGR